MPAGGVLNALNADELQAAAVAELAEDPKQLQVCQGASGGPQAASGLSSSWRRTLSSFRFVK